MNINQSNNFNANITLKDSTGVDSVVGYLTAALDANSMNYNINLSVSNKTLLTTASATNIAGETAQQQYTEFETAVKTAAKNLGYVIFA
ncbi:hypothetical protein [Clostridium sp.]|uniref:hypothetical protein n=1 Tax=Clostridium sp. TaxID=1506 RepID=UPI00260EE7F3|nr:hypothetical protein [Clostridium sp.]